MEMLDDEVRDLQLGEHNKTLAMRLFKTIDVVNTSREGSATVDGQPAMSSNAEAAQLNEQLSKIVGSAESKVKLGEIEESKDEEYYDVIRDLQQVQNELFNIDEDISDELSGLMDMNVEVSAAQNSQHAGLQVEQAMSLPT